MSIQIVYGETEKIYIFVYFYPKSIPQYLIS